MKQQTLAMANGFEQYAKKTRRAVFLEEMEQVVPWAQLCRLIEPHYPKVGNGRPPVGLERMLRVYFLQQWFNLSDPAVEEALYDSAVMRQFAGIDLGSEPVPDETTVCKFRHLLEEHELGERLFERVGEHLQAKGLRLSTGTIVDATIINAPSSTKNARQERDPEMHQTRKGKQWYFGMKAHVGVDSQTKLIHSVVATAANAADGTMLPLLAVIVSSWLIAFFDYCFQVPANRIGYGEFTAFQLKIIQEVITLCIFVIFAWAYFGENIKWNHALSLLFLVGAVTFAFWGKL